jgi:transcriptional regulator with XRE-family HTH domain
VKVNAATRQKLIEIGKMIRATREKVDVSQATLAAKIGMHRENYIRAEMGRVNLTVESLMRIAEGLGVDLVVMLRRHGTELKKAPRKATPRRATG